MPLALAVNVGFWLYTLYVLIYFPLTYFGVAGSGMGYVTLALVGGVIWLHFYVKEKLARHRHEQRWTTERATSIASSDTTTVEQEEKGPGFIEVIWLYLVAMKQKVCPTIEFNAGRTKEGV
jgi:uncharacterized membrane protein